MTHAWWRSSWATVAISFLGTFSFTRASGSTLETAAYVALGVTCISLTIHRLVLLGIESGK